jgi:hypothetical protein
MFSTDDALEQHHSDIHNSIKVRETTEVGVLGKRKVVDDDILPVIEVMPARIARKNRDVYYGPSGSLSAGQNVAVNKKRRKS